MNWYFDSSVLVSAAVAHHPHHVPSLAALEELARRKHHGYISAHGLTEIYSVLTRAPFKPPIYPGEVWQIIETTILPHLELVTLSGREYRDLVRICAQRAWTGGRVHDSVHLRCAEKTDCDRIYTLNVKDFRALAPDGIEDKIGAP